MSRVEEARRRIEEEKKKKQIQKGLDIVQKGKNLKINENKNIFDNVKPKQSFAGDKEEIIGNYTKSSSIDNLYNNVINPMNQFNSSLFYNIGKLPAKAIYKTASAAKNVLRGEEHPFQKAQEKANETFSNFEKNVGYDTSNKDSKIQKANRAGQTVGNTLGYVLGSKALGGGALGYGATSGMNAYANTNDIGDIVFSTSKGAVFGKLNSVIGGGTKNVLERVPIMNTAISATSPSTLGSIFHFGANATKNVIAGGVGMYGAGAITGEAENIYNLIRKRDVTKKDWLKPIWSDEALSNAIIGGIIGGVSGTAADLKKAKLQYKNDYKTLIENLNNKNNAMVKALQNGELQTAQNLNQEAIEMIQAFNNMQYMGFRLDENGKNTLLNMWQATAYANAETNYRPKMLGEETLRQPLDISQLQTNTQMPKNNFNNIKNTTNINEKASTIWQNFKNNAQNSTYNSDQTPKNQNSTQNNFKNDDMNVFDTERKYNTSSLPKNEEEVKTNVRNRLNKEIEKDIEIFVENNTDDYQEIASSDVDYEIEDILRKMYTEEEIDYLYDTDLSSEVFNKISDIISNELEKHFYTFNSETEMYEPNTDKLGNSDEIRFKYDKLPSTDFEYKQLDNIRNMIDDLTWDMKKTLPDGIDITVDESRASADATYITVSNENTDETYEIRVGNHFKSGTSGDADEHIRISDFKTISKLKENLKEKIENGLIDVGGENRQNDTINEQKEKHDVDIIKESDYNNYEVERKKEPRNYIYKNITDEDKARVDSDYKLNKSKYIGKNFVHFDDVSYGYNIEDGEVKVTSKFKGSQKFIREVEEAWENGVDKLSNGNTKITESIRRIKRGGDTSNGISRKQSSSRESDRENIGNGRQQRGIDSTKTSENNGNNLKDSKQSSFSLSENNIKSNEEYDTNLSAEEKLDEYEERKKQALKKIAEKAGVEYSFLDANKGETQRNMFFFLKGHGSLKNQFVKENNINLEGITFEEKYNLIDGNPEFEKFINKITDEYFKISKPEITDEELMEIAQDIHGTTDDYSVGAYMTIDGQLLDFDYGGYRDDHRSLSVPGYDMDSFMKAGNIRMQPEGSGFEVAVEPTEAQYERLADYIDNYIDDDINVDIDGTNDGRTYPRGTDAEKIIDDIRYYFRNGEFPQKSQYANFLEEPHIKYGEQTKNETPIKVLKSTDKILKPQVVGQRIWEGFERQGYINLNSKKVESVQDIAELAQIFRNPKYETFRIIYTSGDIIVGQEAVTSYLPNQSKAFVDNNSNKAFYKMTDRMKRLSADGYYMVHNHPSGVARASKEDIKITKTISDEIVGFKGHIVVDHGTYAYISRGLNGNIEWKDEMKVDTKNALYQGSQFETNMPTNRIPWNNIKISSRDDLGSLMHNLKNSTNYSTLILCDTQNKINSIVDIPNNFFNMKQSQIEGYIRNTSKKYGATYAFVGTSSEDTFNKLKQLTNLRDSVLYQDNTEKFGDKKGNAVFAYEKKFAMRTSEETDVYKSEKTDKINLPEVEKLLYDKEFIYQKVESRLEDAFKFKIGNEDVKIYRKFRDQIKPIIKEKAIRIEQLIKLNALTEDTLNSIINEIFEQEIGITKDEITLAELTREERKALKERNATVKEYIESMHGKNEVTEISNEIKETIQKVNMRFEKAYSDIDKNLVEEAKKEAISLMRSSKKFSNDTINSFLKGYANDYEKGIYSQVLDAFLYYSRPLERIEANNYEGIKKTNYLIEKRKWDLQNSGKIEQSGYKKGVNWRNLRTTIEQHLGKEIRLKGFKEKAYGIYKPTLDEIRTKNISDIETILHELGRRFDFKEIERDVKNTAIDVELMLLCQRAFKDAYNNNPGLMLEEGWAEFTRRFICDNEKTVKEYPATSEFFVNEMDNSKRLQKTVTELIDMVETYVHSNSNTAISAMISVGEDTTEKLTLLDRFDEFMEKIFDDLWSVKKVSKTMAKAKHTKYYKEDPTRNPYYNRRLNKESEEKIKDIIKHGFVDDNGIRVTKGLTEILKPFKKDTKKITDIRNLLWARRAIDYLARDLSSGLGITDTINIITSIKDEDVLNAVQEIEEFANYPFELAYKRGMLTKTQYEDIKKWNKFYVPVKRVFEDQINLAKGKSGKLIKARTGSERDIIDFMETITQNTAFMIDKVSQNEGLQILARNADLEGVSDYYSIIDLPQKLTATVNLDIFKSALQEQLGEQTVDDLGINFGIVRKLFSPKLKDDATRTLTFMQDGKMRAIQFYNDSLYKIYSNANSASMLESLKLFDKATGILRAGATALNAEFALPNMVSDTFVAWVYSDNGFVPIVDTVRGIFDYVIAEYNIGKADTQNKLLYSYYRQSGASMSTRVATFRPEVQNFIEDVIGKHATKIYSDNPKTVKEAFKTILKEAGKLHNGVQDFLSIIPEVSEQATRFSYFKKSYNKYTKKGWEHRRAMLQAGIETKDATVDFNRAGKVTRVTNRLKAFSNAVLQGFYRGLEGMSKNPVKAPTKILFVVATWAIIHKMFGEDKRLEEVSEQTKKDNYVFMIGDTIIKIKKPQDAIVKGLINAYELIGTILLGDEEAISKSFENYAEDIINDITSYNVDFDKTALNNIMSIALQTFTAIEPVAELVGNKDFYFDSQITPYGTEDNSPQYQYDEYTSETAKLLGEKLKESPAQIEHLITSYGAGVGKRLLEISDRIIDFVSDDVTLPDEALSDKFIVNRFVVDENKNSQSVSDVYETYDKLNTKKKDEEFTGIGLSEEEQEKFEKLTQAKETFSEISKEKRKIQSTLSLSGKEKRQKLDELNSLRTDVARYYLDKELINSENRNTIELYEYYPASDEYTYIPKNSLKVKVKYEEEDKKEYAQLCRKKYKELIVKTKASYSYKKADKEEKEKLLESDLTKARNYAKDIVSKKVYERGK